MTNPITPPPELVEKWIEDWHKAEVKSAAYSSHIATQAAQWGADQELEACCEWLCTLESNVAVNTDRRLRLARRPKPPSLKERLSKAIIAGDEREALKLLEGLDD